MIEYSNDETRKGEKNMKLSQKQTNQVIAFIQLFLCGMMAAVAFRREIRLGYKVNNKLKKRRPKKEKRKGRAV